MDARDKIYLKRTDEEKKRIVGVWRAYANTLPEDGKEVIEERANWLESTIEQKKVKKKKKKKIKKKKKGD